MFIFKNKRKAIIFAIFLVILILAAGWFFVLKDKIIKDDFILDNEYVNPEKFQVRNEGGYKVVELKEYGLKLKAPEDWIISRGLSQFDILNSDAKFDEKGNVLASSFKNGACGISISILDENKTKSEFIESDYLLSQMGIAKKNPEKFKDDIKREIINISGFEGLKESYSNKNADSIDIKIPIEKKIYQFSSGVMFNKNCIDLFNEIVGTVSISK